jgi:hypothetical protein
MNTKLSISVRFIVLGLSTLFALSGQAMATTTDRGVQAAPAKLNFGDTFFGTVSQFQVDYKFGVPAASVNAISYPTSFGSTEIAKAETSFERLDDKINPISLGDDNFIPVLKGDEFGSFGSCSIPIPPVPEAGEWVLLLFGLGLIGFIAARRRNK